MEGIGPGFRNHIHHAASGTAVLRLGILSDDLEFLDQVKVWNDDVRWPANVGVDDAVVKVQLGAILLPVDGGVSKAGIGDSNIPLYSANALILRRRNRRDTRSESQQLREIPAIQRDVGNRFFSDHRPEFAGRSFKDRCFGIDCNGFGH